MLPRMRYLNVCCFFSVVIAHRKKATNSKASAYTAV